MPARVFELHQRAARPARYCSGVRGERRDRAADERRVAPYDDWSYSIEELIDAGEKLVVARAHTRGKPRGGTSWVELRYGILYTVEGGLVRRAEIYATVEEALVAAAADVGHSP